MKKIIISIILLLSQLSYAENNIIQLEEKEIIQHTLESSITGFQYILKEFENGNYDSQKALQEIQKDIDFYFDIERISKNMTNKYWNMMTDPEKIRFKETVKSNFKEYILILSESKPILNIIKTESFTDARAKVYLEISFENYKKNKINVILTKNHNFWFISDFEVEGFILSNFVYNNISDYLAKGDYEIIYTELFNTNKKEEENKFLFQSLLNKILKG